jgi:CDP-diacylglycerol---glycerol-3-phosphate 3-phosphatidyltransferase
VDTVTGGPAAPRPNPFAGRIISNGDGPASIANIANIITVVRILLTPLFFWMLLADNGANGALRWIAAATFVIVIATDALDGYLARSRRLVSNVGIILDPIADKALTGAALIGLSILWELPWWITIVILVRELGITIFRFSVLRRRVIPASRGGKAKTVAQAVAISLFLFPLASVLGDWVLWVNWAAMAIALALTVLSGLDYIWAAIKAYRLG